LSLLEVQYNEAPDVCATKRRAEMSTRRLAGSSLANRSYLQKKQKNNTQKKKHHGIRNNHTHN
jgi:hypothetical protein